MTFDEKTRKLTSSTGFLREIATDIAYNYPIYLGIYSNPSEYDECSEEYYNEYLIRVKEEEQRIQEKMQKAQEQSQPEIVVEEEPVQENISEEN